MGFGPGCGTQTKAGKQYQKRVLSTMLFYVAVLFAATSIVRHGHPHGWWLYVLALAPALIVMTVIGYMGIYLRDETDEYMRMVTMRSLLVGTGFLLGAIVMTDFLRSFTTTGNLPPFILFVIFFVAFGTAQGVQQLRNKAGNDE